MTISDTTEQAVMALIFNATAWANYADDAATSPQTQIALALHTADPGDAGTMATSEATYTGYARGAVNRASGAAGWNVATGQATLGANLDFGACTAGSNSITFFSTGKTGGGAAAILFSGAVSPTIAVSSGVTPRLTSATYCALD